MSDKDGIMIGVNKANSSLVIIDIFNSLKYKNANIAIFGTSGSGKTFLMQLMALRMRRKNIQVFIIAPDKGHEFARACNNIGGEFIQISPSSSNCINIMEIRPADMETRDLLDGYTSERSELASKIQSLHIFFSLLIPDMSHEEKQLLDALIVGQNIKVLLKLLESDGGIKKDLFRPDDIYDQYYYIPMCQEGILQIILLTEKQKREKLKQFLLSRFPIRKEKEYAVYAVCDEIGNPVYLGYDLEMRQLCRIKQELLWRPSVSIVCMDYQAEIIREYLGEKVIIYELNTENVMKYLINDIGE